MKLVKSKLLNLSIMLFGLSVIISTLTSCYGDGDKSSNQAMQNITRVNLSSNFVTTNPIKVNHSYVLAVTDSTGEVISSQIFECMDLKACTIDLENIDSSTTDLLFLQIFNGNGGLVAASLMNKMQFISGGKLNSTKVAFSEYSTGVYILAKIQQISDTMYNQYNDDVIADFKERFHLQNVEHPQEIIPMVAYKLANQLGLDEGEASGIFRLWYNIYGDADEYDGISASIINKSVAAMLTTSKSGAASAKSSITRASGGNLAPIAEVDEDDDVKPSGGVAGLQNAHQKLLKNMNLINNDSVVDTGKIITKQDLQNPLTAQKKADDVIPKKDGEKKEFSWVSAVEASGMAKQFGQFVGKQRPPVTSEERATAELISGVLGVVAKAVNAAAPGLGSVFGMLNTFGLEAFFPTKGSNPNAALEAKMEEVNSSVNALTSSINERMDQQDRQTLANIKDARKVILDEGITLTSPYFSYIDTGASNITEAEATNILIKRGYPGYLDAYIQTSSDQAQALNDVKSLFGEKKEVNNFVAVSKKIASPTNIDVFMTALNNVRNNMIENVKKGNSGLDYVAIDEIYYAEILKASTDTMNVLDKMRNTQLAAAYLLRNSSYKSEIGTVYISENAGRNLESYTQIVDAINSAYKEREFQAMEAFAKATAKSTIASEVQPWASNIIKANASDTTKYCTVSYWNGNDLGIMCEKRGIRGSNISTRIYDIINVCQDKLVLDGTRVYCTIKSGENSTYVEAKKFLKANNYYKDETCGFLGLWDCNTKEYNKLFVFDDLNNEGLKNNGIEYIASLDPKPWGVNGSVHEFRVSLKNNGYLSKDYGFGSFSTIGKPITDRYVSYDNHKAWVLSSYDSFTINNTTSGGQMPINTSSTNYTPRFTLGCLTSDCILYINNGVTELYYPDLDYYFTMEVVSPKNDKSYVKIRKHAMAKDSAKLPKVSMPLGDWSTQCNVDIMTYNNDVLSTMCTDGAWSDNKPSFPSVLNYKKLCKLGSYVTVKNNSKNQPILQCVDPK